MEPSTETTHLETHETTVSPDSGDSTKAASKGGYDPAVSSNSEVSTGPLSPEGQDATVSSNAVTDSAVTEDSTAFPPSESPQPPGISNIDHPSGYLMEKKSEEFHTTVESQLTVSMTTEAATPSYEPSSAGGYDSNALGVSDSDLDLQNVETTSKPTESTFASEAESNDKQNITAPGQGISAEPLLENGCPPPEVCGKNCGIYMDSNGCQSCQCLWLPIRKTLPL